MEYAGISEDDDDIDSQDSNTPIDHGHLARNSPSITGYIKKIENNEKILGLEFYMFIDYNFHQSENDVGVKDTPDVT